MSIERRIRRAEEALSMGRESTVVNVVWFGGEPVPAEQRRDSLIVRYVAYEAVQGGQKSEAGHEY